MGLFLLFMSIMALAISHTKGIFDTFVSGAVIAGLLCTGFMYLIFAFEEVYKEETNNNNKG